MDRNNLTEDEILLIQIFLSILLVIALILNIACLFSIKSFKDRVNATEALQFSKTIIIILALVLHLPLEIITTSVKGWNFKNICLLKDFLEKLLIEMYPLTVLVIAITRLRVCVCLGNASILVTKTSAFVTLALSIVFPLGFSLGSFVLKMRMKFAENHRMFIYDLTTLMLVSIVTIFASLVIYVFIFLRVKANAKPVCGFQSRRQRRFGTLQHRRYRKMSSVRQKQDANVQLSIVVLMTVFILSWTMYATLKVINYFCYFKVAKIVLSFSKVVVYLLNPIGEGMFTEQKRNNMEFFLRRICYRTKVNRRIEPDLSSYVESTVVRNVPICHTLSAVQKTGESTSIGKQISNDSLHTKRTGCIIPSFQIPLNGEETYTETKEDHVERGFPKNSCGYCQGGLNPPNAYYNCPAEVSTCDEEQYKKHVSLTNRYRNSSVDVAKIPGLILTPRFKLNDETVSNIIPRRKWQSFCATRPVQSCEPQFRFRSFSDDWKTKNGQNRRMRTSSNCSSKFCKHNIELYPNGKTRNVSSDGINNRSTSSLKSCLKSKTRNHSKLSCDGCSKVFTQFGAFAMTNQPSGVPSDSKGVRFKFSSIGTGYTNDEISEEIIQLPRTNRVSNNGSDNISTLMKHF